MKKGLWIYLAVLVVIAVVSDFLILKTVYLPSATTQNFSTSDDRVIMVSGGNGEMVSVTTASDGYYRIRSGSVIIEGQYLTGDYFQREAQLPVGQWVIEDGSKISFTAVSPSPISVTLTATTDLYFATIIVTILVVMILFFYGVIIVS